MDNVSKIRRVSRWMVIACNVILILLPACILWIWIDFDRFAPLLVRTQGLPLQPENIGPINLILGFIVSMVSASVILYGVVRLRRLFLRFQQGDLFNEPNAQHLLVFAKMLFISVLVSPVAGALLSILLTMNNPPGQRAITLSIGSNEIAVLFLSGIFIAVAWIMREGYRLAAENKEFV